MGTYNTGDEIRDVQGASFAQTSTDDLELIETGRGRVQFSWTRAADSAASDTTTEVIVFALPGPKGTATTRTWRMVAGRMGSNGTATASDSTYATVTVSCYTAAGATKTTIATLTTKTTASGGTGNLAAFGSYAMTPSMVVIPANATITYEVAKASTGVQLPITTFTLIVEPI